MNKETNEKNIIYDAAKQGIKAFKYLFLTGFLFILPNISFIALHTISLVKFGAEINNIFYLILTVITSSIFCIFAFYLTYKFFLIDTIQVIYQYLPPFLKILCDKIAAEIVCGTAGIIKKGYDLSLYVYESFKKAYDENIPGITRKCINFILKKIPFADIVDNVTVNINGENKDEISKELYEQIDKYISKKYFIRNSIVWIFLLLPINLTAQFVLLKLLN